MVGIELGVLLALLVNMINITVWKQLRLKIHMVHIGGLDVSDKTTIQLTPETRDRLYKLKFRRTYDQFLNELCDLYEEKESGNKA